MAGESRAQRVSQETIGVHSLMHDQAVLADPVHRMDTMKARADYAWAEYDSGI